MKKIIIIGAGVGGLTVAYELLHSGQNVEVTILEKEACCGGICRMVDCEGNIMDLGGHRFVSSYEEVHNWWDSIISEDSNEVSGSSSMLIRKRISRIYYHGKFYDYPVKLNRSTIKNMGLLGSLGVLLSYAKARTTRKPEKNMEDYFINHFGKKLYSRFFETYTEKLWGVHPKFINPVWGEERVRGISVRGLIKNKFNKKTLEDEFKYPKHGPGEFWNLVEKHIKDMGGIIINNAKVTQVATGTSAIKKVFYEINGEKKSMEGDIFISTMPFKELIEKIDGISQDKKEIAAELPYRDYMILGVLVKRLNSKLQNMPDCWIYIQDKDVKLGRVQIYNNWSPYMVKDYEDSIWLGLEYFTDSNDVLWNMSEEEFSHMAISEMDKLVFSVFQDDIIITHLEKIKKAYPAYYGSYNRIDELFEELESLENLYCVGRGGTHRYDDMDQTMMGAFEVAKNIIKIAFQS